MKNHVIFFFLFWNHLYIISVYEQVFLKTYILYPSTFRPKSLVHKYIYLKWKAQNPFREQPVTVDVDRKTAVPVNAKYTHNGASGLMKNHCENCNSDARLYFSFWSVAFFAFAIGC